MTRRRKRIVLLDATGDRVFPSLTAAAEFCQTRIEYLRQALIAGRKYKGLSFVYEGSHVIPRDSLTGRHPNLSRGRRVAEFRDGDVYKVYPTITAAARANGLNDRYLNNILLGRRRNRTGKDFRFATALDKCLIEIRDRNKQPYQ